MYKKGQLVSLDLVMSAIIFIILIAFVFLIFNKYQNNLNENINNQDINLKAIQISELLIKSTGDPRNWETDSSKVNNIGLVNSDRRLSDKKIEEFIDLDYDLIKQKFNIENFEFYFVIKNRNGAILKVNDKIAETGVKPELASKKAFTVKRAGLLGKDEKIVEIMLWK